MTPLPWLDYLILQSGTPAIGLDAGVSSLEIDYNQFDGDAAKFAHYFGTAPQTELPTEGETTVATYEIKTPTTAGVALRPEHNTVNDSYLYIPAGQVLPSDSIFTATAPLGSYQYIGDKWALVTYGGKTGWVALIHKGLTVCTYRELTPPVVEVPDFIVAHFANGVEKKYVPE
jgi:hypothetical protein